MFFMHLPDLVFRVDKTAIADANRLLMPVGNAFSGRFRSSFVNRPTRDWLDLPPFHYRAFLFTRFVGGSAPVARKISVAWPIWMRSPFDSGVSPMMRRS